MIVAVRAFATLTAFLPPSDIPGQAGLDVQEGATVRDIVEALAIPSGLPWLILVNGQEALPAQVLEAGDVVTLIPPLVGG